MCNIHGLLGAKMALCVPKDKTGIEQFRQKGP